MNNDSIEIKEYNSIEEIIGAFLPGTARKEMVNKITDPRSLGILLAKTDVKDIKSLLENNSFTNPDSLEL
jgi:hypothetical protein